MESFLVSTGIVALAEIGDKTQLLAFILAAKFRRPVPIIVGILLATIANHGFAGALGAWITSLVARVRQLRSQVLVFARADFQKCHYNSASCSGAAGFSIPNA